MLNSEEKKKAGISRSKALTFTLSLFIHFPSVNVANSHYQHQLYYCCNQRAEGGTCCANADAEAAQTSAKDRIGEVEIKGRGKVRISKSGFIFFCCDGPVLVVYPEGVWYRYEGLDDVDAIIQEHLLNGRPVERLRLASSKSRRR